MFQVLFHKFSSSVFGSYIFNDLHIQPDEFLFFFNHKRNFFGTEMFFILEFEHPMRNTRKVKISLFRTIVRLHEELRVLGKMETSITSICFDREKQVILQENEQLRDKYLSKTELWSLARRIVETLFGFPSSSQTEFILFVGFNSNIYVHLHCCTLLCNMCSLPNWEFVWAEFEWTS